MIHKVTDWKDKKQKNRYCAEREKQRRKEDISYKKRRNLLHRRWVKNHPNYYKGYATIYMRKVKDEVISHYSYGANKCACCGENQRAFLSLDHIEGGGNQHRKKVGRKYGSIHYWLKKKGYPKGFQVLCYNCNMAKSFRNGCPHKTLLNTSPKQQ